VREAHLALAERAKGSSLIDFAGNVEGTQILHGAADVVVTDGFTGNVALKLIESTSQRTIEAIREVAEGSHRGRLGGLLLRKPLHALREDIDPEVAGGAYLLGLRRLGIVAHGRFTRAGFAQAMLLAARGVRGDVVGRTREALEESGARRRSPAASAEASSVRSP
jgi:phosphate acyltransferase